MKKFTRIAAALCAILCLFSCMGGALAANAVTGAYAVGDVQDMAAKVHEELTVTGRYEPKEKLTLPEIPFKL